MLDLTVYDGIPEALAQMAGPLYLATAKPHVYATQITARFGLAPFLAAQFGPELDGTRKDKGELLAYALDLLGFCADQAVMVGDRGSDLRAARDVGMRFIGVTWGYAQANELDGADALCHRPADLARLCAES